ncbi:hypothetical protein QM797_16525 [Rhodococcus sp. IEGM 1381]|nr:hypothetical protein [Rhodococcus sp. IEGM 1381]
MRGPGGHFGHRSFAVWGYLTTAGNAVPVQLPNGGSASVLPGCTPDATHWLDPRAAHIVDTPFE